MRSRSAAVRMPTRSRARANACEPRISASMRRRSKSSEPEKRSKTSEGPDSKRPPQSFIERPRNYRGDAEDAEKTRRKPIRYCSGTSPCSPRLRVEQEGRSFRSALLLQGANLHG